ncbi:MAG: hypothetical protein WBC07_11980 [Methylotenera sp.]
MAVNTVFTLGTLGTASFGPRIIDALGPGGYIFGRAKLGGSSVLNINSNDLLRIGWGWKGSATNGSSVFRISGQWVEKAGVKNGHIDLQRLTKIYKYFSD